MTLYLTEQTGSEIAVAKASDFVHAVKWYPAGATTNSHHGVQNIEKCFAVLEAMQQHDLPLLVHPETTDRPSIRLIAKPSSLIAFWRLSSSVFRICG